MRVLHMKRTLNGEGIATTVEGMVAVLHMTEAQLPANGRKIKTLESAASIGKRLIEPQLRMRREH